MVHQDIGRKLIEDIILKLADVSKVEQPPKLEGRHMTTILIPEKKKIQNLYKQKKAEQNKEKELNLNK